MVVAAGLLLALLVVPLAPSLGMQRLPFLAAVLAARNAWTVALAAVCVGLLGAILLRRRARRALLPFALASMVALACTAPTVLLRGFRQAAPAPSPAADLRILSWNINGDLVAPSVVARLAARERADIVVLPEIGPAEAAAGYAAAFRAVGLDVTAFPPLSRASEQTVVFVTRRLGGYVASVARSAEPERSAALAPRSPESPRIVAIHAVKPLPGRTAAWSADLAWIAERCDDPNTIAVGDLNATADHFVGGELGGCRDAAVLLGSASVGTWPTSLPVWLAMPIDHVLVSADWSPRSFTVLTEADGSGARHRPVLAVVRRSGG